MKVLCALVAAVCLVELAICQEPCKVDSDCAGHTCHHGSPHCEVHDPNMEHGHCNCHAAKRAEETCTVDADCASHTCHHGSPNCEIHDPNNQHGHCNCHSAKRAEETCTVDADCASHTCHHGSPNCEIHDPNNQHGHCNCHSAKRAEETCTVDADCASHTCHHGSPHCEIHDPKNQHGHCNCHSAKRATCHNGHQCSCNNGGTGVCNSQGHCDCGTDTVGRRAAETCDTTSHKPQCGNTMCPSGNNAVCNQEGHCECGDHAVVGKRNGEPCSTDAECEAAGYTCNHGAPNCEIHGGQTTGHCNCHSAIARALRATHCNSNADCTNTCAHGMEAYCDMSSAEHGHWACDCRHHG